MQVKIFEAADMASGLNMIRNELGPDALILSTRSIRSGKLGILGKPILEITAAIETPSPVEQVKVKKSISKHSTKALFQKVKTSQSVKGYEQSPKINLSVDEPVAPITYNEAQYHDEPTTNYQQKVKVQSEPSYTSQPQTDAPQTDNDSIRDEMSELKNLVRNLTKEVSKISTSQQPIVISEEQNSPILKGVQDSLFAGKELDDPIIDLLLNHGINLETSSTIADFTKDTVTEDILNVPEKLSSFMQSTISSLIQTQAPTFGYNEHQQRIALVGPTGVGKTTTIAKMAAKYLSQHSNSVALITIDTYRIAAVEQLKVYGEIMNLPVDVVITPQDLEESITRHQDKDLILIDTAGRSPKDSFCIDELSSFLQPHLDIQKHLVLSSTTRENELISTIQQFDKLGIDQTIMTKIDECHNLGVLLNVQIQNPNPISFITNGQRVPEDIIVADQQVIAELIMSN